MRPVIRVSLNGHALQLEDDAHALLTSYLEAAGRSLDGNPDRAEILADLEQSIVDRSARFLGAGRDVLTREQVAGVLDEIGPVEPAPGGEAPAAAAGPAGAAAASGGASANATGFGSTRTRQSMRRLQQVSDGAIVSGVCNGLAAWANVDVTVVRIVAVVLAFATGGALVFAYLLLMLILPYSSDPVPPNGLPRASRSLVQKLRGQTAEFATNPEWRQFHADVRHALDRANARVAASSVSPALVVALVVLLIATAVALD